MSLIAIHTEAYKKTFDFQFLAISFKSMAILHLEIFEVFFY